MTDWIEHNGGPQPVDDDVWVETAIRFAGVDGGAPSGGYIATCKSQHVSWGFDTYWRTINQHLIDTALKRGIELGLEAAAKVATEKVEERIGVTCPDGVEGCAVFHFRREYRDKSADHIEYEIRALNPETIAKEAHHD